MSNYSALQHYKIKLSSGRVVGPVDIDRIKTLILKKHITGVEVAREYPNGDWHNVNSIAAIAELLTLHAAGQLKRENSYQPILGVHEGALDNLPTAIRVADTIQLGEPERIETAVKSFLELAPPEKTREATALRISKPEADPEVEEKTQLHIGEDPGERTLFDKTRVAVTNEPLTEIKPWTHEPTIVLERPTGVGRAGTPDISGLPWYKRYQTLTVKEKLRAFVIVVALATAAHELFVEEIPPPPYSKMLTARAHLPQFVEGQANPKKSEALYQQGMQAYIKDHVYGYVEAATLFEKAASNNINNVKALAMLASSYLNLIDSSAKDENYFAVISKLVEMTRAKESELPETVIADTEFYLVVGKGEAAQSRVIEFTKSHQKFGLDMFYYLALAFFERGDAQNAARYLSQFPEDKVYSPKIFHLRGLIAEKLGANEEALKEYNKAVKMRPDHVRSRLRIAEILSGQAKLKEAVAHLDYIVGFPGLSAPKDLARGLYLHARLAQSANQYGVAIRDLEKAVKLDKTNSDYLLEYYTLKARTGENIESAGREARMYFYLSLGEKMIKASNYQGAIVEFLKARQENLESPLPSVKMGDMFMRLGDVGNAKRNYRQAAQKAQNDIDIWSRYIDSLIASYDWDEANKAMERFRSLPVPQSALDKAAGDMYAKRGQHIEAQMFYKKAMSRESIDSDVYIAYGKSLMATKKFREAPFFFALATRFDPLNSEAILNTARAVAESESIDRGIALLQDELQKGGKANAEYLAGIAELQIRKGEWGLAQQFVDQARTANPDYAYPWKLQGQIFQNFEGLKRDALDRALDAYKSYSDRNSSDPSGYLERYRLFIKKTQFDLAKEELLRIHEMYPKFPNLHYYFGKLYAIQGNHRAAIKELELERENNPASIPTLLELGKEYLEVEMVIEGLNFFNRAMQMSPNTPDPKHWSGWSNYLLKNYVGAVALLTAAQQMDRGNPLIYKRLGIVYRDMGDGGNAKAAFRKYLEMEPDAKDRAQFEKYLN